MDAKKLHNDLFIWDCHRDVGYEIPPEERKLSARIRGVDLNLEDVRKGGIDVQVYALCMGHNVGLSDTSQTLLELEETLEILEASTTASAVTSVKEARLAREDGKTAAFLAFEGAHPIGREISLLRAFHRLGIRVMGLSWNNTAVANGTSEGRNAGGLTNFGRKVIEEMQNLPMIIDLSHVTESAIEEVAKMTKLPLLYSHGCARTLNDHRRCSSDHILEKIAKSGGVFCITSVPAFLSSKPPGEVTIEDMVNHIDYAVKIMGIDHVGLGADCPPYWCSL